MSFKCSLKVVEDSGWGWDHFAVRAVTSRDHNSLPVKSTTIPVLTVDTDDKNISKIITTKLTHGKLVSNASVGQLYAIKTLDYENPAHRRGFRFLVEVTDRVCYVCIKYN